MYATKSNGGNIMLNGFLKSEKAERVRKFVLDDKFMLILFALAAVVTVFHIEAIGVALFILIVSFILVVSDDLLATTLPFLLISETLIKCYGSYAYFIKIVWVAVPLVAALIFHFVHYRQPIKTGKLFTPIVMVSLAVTLGGLGFISAKEFFSLVSFYYVFGLGFGMLLIYIMLNSCLRTPREYSLKGKFTNIMIYMGLFAVFMLLEYYIENASQAIMYKSILYIQWRNNISTFLMFAMPFAAFKAVKKPSYIFLSLIFYVSILLTGSRGGMLFGFIELMMSLSILINIDKRHRWTFIAIGGGIVFAIALFMQDFFGFFGATFDRLIGGLSGDDKEVRLQLFQRAFQDFYDHPVFGTGLAYMGNRDVHPSAEFALCWYHCEPLQIMASLGLVGVAAYSVQFISRIILFIKKRTVFNVTVLVAYLGIEMMSLVNPGIFCPVPYLFLVTMFLSIVEYVNETDSVKDLKDDILLSQEKEEQLDEDEEEDEDELVPIIYK